MKANIKPQFDRKMIDALKEQISDEFEREYLEKTQAQIDVLLTGWNICLATVLRNMGFGKKRMFDFFREFHSELVALDVSASAATRKSQPNLDFGDASTAFAHRLRDLNEADINFRELLNVDEIWVNDTEVCALADRISRHLPSQKGDDNHSTE